MEGEGEIEAHIHEFGKVEEKLEQGDGDVFDTVLSFDTIHELKTKRQTFKDLGTNLHDVY